MYDYNIHLTIDGKDVILNNEQRRSIHDQQMAMNAYDLLSCYECTNKELVSFEDLVRIGQDLEDYTYDNNGDVEYAILQEYVERGIVIQD